jgi:pimeloyl-ACP methyl ester carboxylesterase
MGHTRKTPLHRKSLMSRGGAARQRQHSESMGWSATRDRANSPDSLRLSLVRAAVPEKSTTPPRKLRYLTMVCCCAQSGRDGAHGGYRPPESVYTVAAMSLNDLEVIERGVAVDSRPPLLFVHGAWHAAWCWEENFLGFFANKGYRAVAMSLRNHGNSYKYRPRRCSVADYVDDVATIVDTLPAAPVLIGHSLGGLVVRLYLERYSAPAGVLLASGSAKGAARGISRVAARRPLQAARAALRGRSLGALNTPEAMRQNFLSAGTPESDVVRYAATLDEEYWGRVTIEVLLGLPKPQPHRVTTPLLVLGADNDACLSQRAVVETASAYGTSAEFFPGMAHNMMLDAGWVAVAQCIDEWLRLRAM